MFKLIHRKEYRGTRTHRDGWPWVVEKLLRHSTDDGVLLDDFFEQSLSELNLWQRNKPWVGVFHHPPTPNGVPMGHGTLIGSYLGRPEVKHALKTLQAAIVMSPVSRDFLSSRLNCPVFLAKHPTPMHARLFDPSVLTYPRLGVVQFGFYMKNVRAIYQLPSAANLFRRRMSSRRPYEVKFDEACRARRKRPEHPGVDELGRLTSEQFDDVLSTHVAFFEYYAATASNAVLECIARNTPVVLNRLSSHEYYLGRDYPLFYDKFDRAVELLTPHKLLEGHQYLVAMDKSDLSSGPFVDTVLEASRCRSPSLEQST